MKVLIFSLFVVFSLQLYADGNCNRLVLLSDTSELGEPNLRLGIELCESEREYNESGFKLVDYYREFDPAEFSDFEDVSVAVQIIQSDLYFQSPSEEIRQLYKDSESQLVRNVDQPLFTKIVTHDENGNIVKQEWVPAAVTYSF